MYQLRNGFDFQNSQTWKSWCETQAVVDSTIFSDKHKYISNF